MKNLFKFILSFFLVFGIALNSFSFIASAHTLENNTNTSEIDLFSMPVEFDMSNFSKQEQQFITQDGELATIVIEPVQTISPRFSYNLDSGTQTWKCYVNVGIANYGFWINFTQGHISGKATINRVYDDFYSLPGLSVSSATLSIQNKTETSSSPASARYVIEGKVLGGIGGSFKYTLKGDIKNKVLKIY